MDAADVIVAHRLKLRLLWGFLILVLAVVVGRSAWVWWGRQPLAVATPGVSAAILHVYGAVPDFSLTDQAGRPVTLSALKGQVWIADFIFTHCAGQCPMMTSQMVRLQTNLPNAVQFVSFSVDPRRDTPRVLSQYAKAHGADERRWRFLTGQQEDLYRLSQEGFRLALEPTGGGSAEPILHSKRLVLVDRQAGIRGYYDGSDDPAVQRLIRDARTLLHETEHSH